MASRKLASLAVGLTSLPWLAVGLTSLPYVGLAGRHSGRRLLRPRAATEQRGCDESGRGCGDDAGNGRRSEAAAAWDEAQPHTAASGEAHLESSPSWQGRRVWLGGTAAAAFTVASMAPAALAQDSGVSLGGAAGQQLTWRKPSWAGAEKERVAVDIAISRSPYYSLAFRTYLTRFLLLHDSTCARWWSELPAGSRRLSAPTWRQFRSSVDSGLVRDWSRNEALSANEGTPLSLCYSLIERFGATGQDPTILVQLAILFSLLEEDHRPGPLIRQVLADADKRYTAQKSTDGELELSWEFPLATKSSSSVVWWEDPATLFPVATSSLLTSTGGSSDSMAPSAQRVKELSKLIATDLLTAESECVSKSASAADADGAAAAVKAATSAALSRERPLDASVYTLFAIAGAAGCTLTHSVLVPIDVVKTRKQTDPATYGDLSLLSGAQRVFKDEGLPGLFLGLGPTIVGYVYYGVTVYPGYEFLKRLLFELAGPTLAATIRVPLVLLAGAGATCVACLGVCPAEAVRIRAVAEPQLGGGGTIAMRIIEDEGWQALYAGLPPLLVRQVLFGMMKFLVFDTFAEFVYATSADLGAGTPPTLLVSLLSGAVAGIASTIVSQPGDAVLTRMAMASAASSSTPDRTEGAGGEGEASESASGDAKLSVVGAATALWEESGGSVAPFFRGVGSRAVWAGCVIAGQFFLYDVFKSQMGVTAVDLTQVLDPFGTAGVTASSLI